MHADNPYAKPLQFKELAKTFADVRAHCRLSGGRVLYDFSRDGAVRALTRALLKRDFGLDVILPESQSRLCPRVPSRLDYLLWLRQWLDELDGTEGQARRIVDVGTGASAVYALLAASGRFGWQAVGTERDEESANVAELNVRTNGLEERVRIERVAADEKKLLEPVISTSAETFDACVCNPPFFGDEETEQRFAPCTSDDGASWMNARVPIGRKRRRGEEREEGERPLPHSATVAAADELATETVHISSRSESELRTVEEAAERDGAREEMSDTPAAAAVADEKTTTSDEKAAEMATVAPAAAVDVTESKAQAATQSTSSASAAAAAAIPTRQYLDQSIVPVLLQGLGAVAKERPADPIEYLAKFLLAEKEKYTLVNPPPTTS